jgi:hypothetical protein
MKITYGTLSQGPCVFRSLDNVYYYNPFANEVFSWDIPLVKEENKMNWRLGVVTMLTGFLFLLATPFTGQYVMAQNIPVKPDRQVFWNQTNYPSDWTTGTGRYGVLEGYTYPSTYLFRYQSPFIPYTVSPMYQATSPELPQYAFAPLSLPDGYDLRKSYMGTPTFVSMPFGCQPIWEKTRVLHANLLNTPIYCPVFIPSLFWLTSGLDTYDLAKRGSSQYY